MPTIDLNTDLGEGYGVYRSGDDDAMLSVVTSASVACGLHAGDPEIMTQVFSLAKERGVAVGAHPGYPDLWGFGRRIIPFSIGQIERLVAYQIGAAQALAAYAGHRITFVKTHGALGNVAAADREVAGAVARAVRAVDRSLLVVAIALSEQIAAAQAEGLGVVAEIYADRGYTEEGRLMPRGKPGAMVENSQEAANRVLAMIRESAVITAAGARLPAKFGSVCVHADTAGAVNIARSVRARLEEGGVTVAASSAR